MGIQKESRGDQGRESEGLKLAIWRVDASTGLTWWEKSYLLEMGAAMALFYDEPEDDNLLPISFQLGGMQGPHFMIWTPKDTWQG